MTKQTTFYLRRYYRNLGFGLLAGFLGMWCALLVYLIAGSDVPWNNRLLLFLLGSVVWGFFAFLATWIVLAYYRESLTIQGGIVTQQGVVRRKQVLFSEVLEVRWHAGGTGVVDLRTIYVKLRIYLDNFELEERLAIIRMLHTSFREAIQRDWPLFCLKRALPWRKAVESAETPPRPADDEILLTRRRLDAYLAVGVGLTVPLGIWSWWLSGNTAALFAPLLLGVPWVYQRFLWPKKGIVTTRLSSTRQPIPRAFLIWIGAGLFGALAMCITDKLGLFDAHPWVVGIYGVSFLAGLLWIVSREESRQRQRDLDEAPTAVAEWELGELEHQARGER